MDLAGIIKSSRLGLRARASLAQQKKVFVHTWASNISAQEVWLALMVGLQDYEESQGRKYVSVKRMGQWDGRWSVLTTQGAADHLLAKESIVHRLVKYNIKKFRKKIQIHQCDTCYLYGHKTCDGPLTCSRCGKENARTDCKSHYTVCVPCIREGEPNHYHPTIARYGFPAFRRHMDKVSEEED